MTTMKLIYSPLPKLNLQRVDKETGRIYIDSQGNEYISVTRFVDSLDEDKKKSLEKWRERVGDKEADRIIQDALKKGTAIHEMCEKYLLGEDNYTEGHNYAHKFIFLNMKKYLDKNINKIYGIEHKLCSQSLGLAGTADVICEWNNVPSILDFKTSRYEKSEDMIHSYFVQATIYALMTREQYNMPIENIIILMASGKHDVFLYQKNIYPYVKYLKEKGL